MESESGFTQMGENMGQRLEAEHDLEEDEREAEEEQDRQAALKEAIEAGVFDNFDLNLNEDSVVLEDGGQTMTSTPFHRHVDDDDGLESGAIEDTPQRPQVTPQRPQVTAHLDDQRQLKILYEARGQEIERLKEERDRLQVEDVRKLQHKAALLEAEVERQKVQAEANREAFEAAFEDNRLLKEDNDKLRLYLEKCDRDKEDRMNRAESQENIIIQLQSQLTDVQKRETVLKVSYSKLRLIELSQNRLVNRLAL